MRLGWGRRSGALRAAEQLGGKPAKGRGRGRPGQRGPAGRPAGRGHVPRGPGHGPWGACRAAAPRTAGATPVKAAEAREPLGIPRDAGTCPCPEWDLSLCSSSDDGNVYPVCSLHHFDLQYSNPSFSQEILTLPPKRQS